MIEQLTELRKVLYLLLPVYGKGHNSGTAKWKRYIEHGVREGAPSFHALFRYNIFLVP